MRKAICLLISVVLISGGLTGCAVVNSQMKSWEGCNVNDLIASWGPPQQTMSDGQGGQILIYSQVKQWTTPGYVTTTSNANVYGGPYNAYGTGTSQTVYNPPQTSGYCAQRMFWVNSNGTIYKWAWKGL